MAGTLSLGSEAALGPNSPICGAYSRHCNTDPLCSSVKCTHGSKLVRTHSVANCVGTCYVFSKCSLFLFFFHYYYCFTQNKNVLV